VRCTCSDLICQQTTLFSILHFKWQSAYSLSLIEGIARLRFSLGNQRTRRKNIAEEMLLSNLNDNFVDEQKTSLFHMDVFIEAKAFIDFKQCFCVEKGIFQFAY
jgi:intein-encoded DNA endonuclease-like protein